jgi:hypothetical protein
MSDSQDDAQKSGLGPQLMAQGPPQSYVKEMADAEDAAGCVSVGGMAADMGQPVSVAQVNAEGGRRGE